MSLIGKAIKFADNYPKRKFIFVLILSFIAFIFFNIYLGVLYENTGYPVPLIEGQLRFDAQLLTSDLAVLIENNTIEDYILIQYLDLGIMISTAIFFTVLAFFIFKRLKSSTWKRKGFIFSIFFPLSSFFDLIENSFLLTMVYNPNNFSDWLAIAYSGSAVLKLLSFLIGILAIILIPIFSKFNKD